MFSDANLNRLLAEDLFYISRDGRYYRATQLGYDLLRHCGYDYQPDEYRESAQSVLQRREESARVMLTLMLAGFDVFATDASQLTNSMVYLPSCVVRRVQRKGGRNLAGNTRFTGIGGMIHAARSGGVKAHIFAFRSQCEALRMVLTDIAD